MKKILAILLMGGMALSLIACDEDYYSSDSNSSNISDKITNIIDKILDDDLDEDKNTSFTIAGVELSIPHYYKQIPEIISGNTSITDFEVIENDTTLVRLRIAEENLSVSQNELDNAKDIISSNIAGTNEISNANDITLAGLSGRSFSFTTSNENVDVLISHITFAYNVAEQKILYIFIIASDNLIDEYIDDYNKIIETAKLVTDNVGGQEDYPGSDDKNSKEQFDIDKDLVVTMCERDDEHTSMYNIVFTEYNEDGVPINFYAFNSYDGCINPRAMGKNFNAIGGLPSWFYVGATVHVKANLSGNGLSTVNCSVTPS